VRKFGRFVVGHYYYDAYATTDNDIVTTDTQTDEEIVRKVRYKEGKLDPEEEEGDDKDEEANREETKEKT
jgi:hypothetical protein